MKAILKFANRKPFLFVITVLVVWILLVSISAIITGALLNMSMGNLMPQAISTLIATFLLLFGAARIGWIKRIGIASPGSGIAWLVTLAVAIYVLLVDFYAFFREVSFQPVSLFNHYALGLILRALQVGFVEEVVFRGIILYGLVRVWGKSKRGLFAALAVQSALFGTLHALQAFFGADPASAISNVLATFIFGLWVGSLVISVRSVWPAIILHAVSNSFVLIKGISSQWVTPYYLGYLRESLFELPLVLLGLWFVLKYRPDARRGSDTLSDSISET